MGSRKWMAMSENLILELVREDDFKYDPYGSAMSVWFSVADLLVEWGPPYPPKDWEFRQAMSGSNTESYVYQELSPMLKRGELTADDLLEAGNILNRYVGLLKHAGRDY